jgi:hypothetical protein
MTLTVFGWIAAAALGAWVFLSLWVAYIDWRTGLEHRTNLELREWREKVDAMRRIYDMEGDA